MLLSLFERRTCRIIIFLFLLLASGTKDWPLNKAEVLLCCMFACDYEAQREKPFTTQQINREERKTLDVMDFTSMCLFEQTEMTVKDKLQL